MGRPAKTLQQHVREGTFRARRARHMALLAGPPLPWPVFASLQAQFAQTRSEPERRAVALEFERLVSAAHAETLRRNSGADNGAAALHAQLSELGKPGSVAQLKRFFPSYFVHPKGPMLGKPFQLERWQQRFLNEFYRRDDRGERVYRSGVLGVPRGNGKTPLAAGLGLYELLTRTDAPEIYCAAGSKEQAGIALGFARDFVEQGALADWIQLKSTLRCAASKGLMKVISSEGKLGHGLAPALALIDELWAFETKRERETYTALASALHKRDDAYLLAITTAGYDQHSLLGEIYQAALSWPDVQTRINGCLTVCRDVENGQLLWWYGAPEEAAIDDPAIWRATNPASWIKERDLKRQLADPGLGELGFRRLHLNQWTRARNSWLPGNTWRDLQTDHDIPTGAAIYIGVDVGLVHDSTAVCVAHKLEDGRIALRAHVWSAKDEAPAHEHCPGGKVELERVEQYIRQLARTYKLREVAYDPRYFERSAQMLEREGLKMVEFLPASAPMGDAYQAFYQLALEGKLSHDGDPIFAAHIDATAADKTEHGWKIRKLKSSQQIDATVAAVLAVARALHDTPKPGPQIFWMEP
jgi:phage terminase large subunit-like protein